MRYELNHETIKNREISLTYLFYFLLRGRRLSYIRACFDSFCQVWWMCFFFFFLQGGGPTGMFPLIRYERISSRWGLSRLHSSTNKGKWKGGFFSQPLDLRGCNHMAITPSWRAPFISPSHLWLPAPGFISPATYWWNSAAFVQCNPAYSYGYVYFNLATFENSVFVLKHSLSTLAFIQKLLIHTETSENP